MTRKIKRKPVLITARTRLCSAITRASENLSKDIRRDFTDKFTLCDLACKTLLEGYYKYTGTFSPGKSINLNIKQIPSAVSLHALTIPNHVLNGIFGGTGQYIRRGAKSVKKLRDGVLHAMNNIEVQEIVNQYDQLNQLRDTFLSSFTI